MSLLKKLEAWNKKFWYESVIKFLFRNAPVSLPIAIEGVKRLLVIRRDMIGDMIVTSSLIRTLNRLKPDLEIDVYASPQSKVIIETNPRIKTIFSSKPFEKTFWHELQQARKRDYDVILCLSYTGTTVSGLLANLISRRAIKVGMLERGRENLYQRWFNAQIDIGKSETGATMPLWKGLHVFLTTLFGIPFNEAEIKQEIFTTESERSAAEQFKSQHHLTRYVIFNLSARVSYRKWGMENNLSFLQQAGSRYPNIQFVVTFSPNDKDEALELAESLALPNVHFVTNLNLRAISHLISGAMLIVSPDTAIVHIGATYKVPSVILCTPLSSGVEWEPLHTEHINLYTEKADPISTISPMRVLEAFETMLAQQMTNKTIVSP